MATHQEEILLRNTLSENIEVIGKTVPEELVQEERLGKALSFAAGVNDFRKAINLFQDLQDLDLSRIPYETLSSINNQAVKLKGLIEQINNFTPAENSPVSTRDSLVDQFRNNYHAWFTAVSPVTAYATNHGTDLEAIQSEARELVLQIHAIKEESGSESTKLLKEVNSTLEKVRMAAADVGVAQHSTHFQAEAKDYENSAKKWLYCVIGLGVATAAWGLCGFNITLSENQQTQSIYLIKALISRASVLMTLLIMLFWASKNYAASRHNYVVNKHRQNALSTFETFVKAAGDDVQTKHAVLLQATQSIFSAQSTGFSGKDSDSESPGKIIEIVKDVSKAAR